MKEIKRRKRRTKQSHKDVIKILKRISKKMATQADLDAKEAEILTALQTLTGLIGNGQTVDTAPVIASLQPVLDGINALIAKLQPVAPQQ